MTLAQVMDVFGVTPWAVFAWVTLFVSLEAFKKRLSEAEKKLRRLWELPTVKAELQEQEAAWVMN